MNRPLTPLPWRIPQPSPISWSQFEPEIKAIILYFLFYAEFAAAHRAGLTTEEKEKLRTKPAAAASDFLKKVYNVDLGLQSIETFYSQAKEKARFFDLEWNQLAVAEMICGQTQDEDLYFKISTFLCEHYEVSFRQLHFSVLPLASAESSFKDEGLGEETRWLMSVAWRAAGGASEDPRANNSMWTYWQEIVKLGRPHSGIEAPDLRPDDLGNPTTSSNG
ncbi:MAG: hypothetical protein ASARMPRED_003877 [Alectoria sarmentosa]|nr:MAG: hypothetical protein ASARMPRED_003877 [Alectoria sarmentosa]